MYTLDEAIHIHIYIHNPRIHVRPNSFSTIPFFAFVSSFELPRYVRVGKYFFNICSTKNALHPNVKLTKWRNDEWCFEWFFDSFSVFVWNTKFTKYWFLMSWYFIIVSSICSNVMCKCFVSCHFFPSRIYIYPQFIVILFCEAFICISFSFTF